MKYRSFEKPVDKWLTLKDNKNINLNFVKKGGKYKVERAELALSETKTKVYQAWVNSSLSQSKSSKLPQSLNTFQHWKLVKCTRAWLQGSDHTRWMPGQSASMLDQHVQLCWRFFVLWRVRAIVWILFCLHNNSSRLMILLWVDMAGLRVNHSKQGKMNHFNALGESMIWTQTW